MKIKQANGRWIPEAFSKLWKITSHSATPQAADSENPEKI